MDTTYQSNNNVIPQARYLSTPETLLDGQFAPASCDASGNTKQSLGTTIAGEDIPNDVTKVEMRNNDTYISTATTTVCKTGTGLLHTLTVTGGTAGTIIGYDNTALLVLSSSLLIVQMLKQHIHSTYHLQLVLLSLRVRVQK